MQTLSISTFGWKTWHSFAIGWILLSCVLQGPGPFGRRSGIETVLEQQRILWNLHLPSFCQNVTNHLLDLAAHDRTGRLVPSYVCSLNMCAQHTDQSINQAAKKLVLEKGRLGKGAFEDLEKALGLTFAAEGALYDENFMNSIPGAVSMTSYDWMHIYLVSGLWNSEVSLLLDVAQQRAWDGSSSFSQFPQNCHVAQESFLQRPPLVSK